MPRYVLLLGSNVEREANLARAEAALDRDLEVLARSRVHESEAVGDPGGPRFFNRAMLVRSGLDAYREIRLRLLQDLAQPPGVRGVATGLAVQLRERVQHTRVGLHIRQHAPRLFWPLRQRIQPSHDEGDHRTARIELTRAREPCFGISEPAGAQVGETQVRVAVRVFWRELDHGLEFLLGFRQPAALELGESHGARREQRALVDRLLATTHQQHRRRRREHYSTFHAILRPLA